MAWFPLCNYTHYSLLRGFSKPEQLAQKCQDNGYKSCGIADYKTISGAVAFYKACKKRDIKPIIGCSFDGFTLFAKNESGWFDLIKIVSSIDEAGNPDKRLLIDICQNGNLISVGRKEYDSPVSGGDFYFKALCLSDSYYTNKEDAELHRILLCSDMKTTLPKIRKKLQDDEDFPNKKFFENDHFFVLSKIERVEAVFEDPEGLRSLEEIDSKCESYNILHNPVLPHFETPDGSSEEEYLRLLCETGFQKFLLKMKDKEVIYRDRLEKEFLIIKGANLSGYFLVVSDILDYVRAQGWMAGPGRGSAAGCLISFLIGITEIDPIEFDLLFERFYNPGRNTETNVELPDIDIDIPGKKRDQIIVHLKDKYGHENVSQMVTFGRLQGRSAIKEVLRINEACGFGQMNEITKVIPNEAEISDQLTEMEDEDRSIIWWALSNRANELRDYCYINDNIELEGDFSEYFRQAIAIEGTLKTQGKHAAGIIISAVNLNEVCPMVVSKHGGEKMAALEMNDLGAIGLPKFDILAINLLDKLMYIEELIDEA